MKFARKVRVFRGQLDAAPFVSVLFLLVLFLLLNTSLVFVPGVRLETDSEVKPRGLVVRYREGRRVEVGAETMAESAFEARLRQWASSNALPARLIVVADASVGTTNLAQLRALARELKIELETPSSAIALPNVGPTPGVLGRKLAVAVNLSGQLFFDNRLYTEIELKSALRAEASAAQGPLTLLILADGGVPHETVMRIVALGREVGLQRFVQAVRPAVLGDHEGGASR